MNDLFIFVTFQVKNRKAGYTRNDLPAQVNCTYSFMFITHVRFTGGCVCGRLKREPEIDRRDLMYRRSVVNDKYYKLYVFVSSYILLYRCNWQIYIMPILFSGYEIN